MSHNGAGASLAAAAAPAADALAATGTGAGSSVRDGLTITNDWGASELALLREACRLKGVRAIYVDPAWTG
jgi:hypothetical protein